MIHGSATGADLAAAAATATIETFSAETVQFGGVECFQAIAEMRNSAREAALPSGLHPTVPPGISLQGWNVATSPWGPFSMANVRVTCRSGVRARGFMVGAVVSTEVATAGLRSTFGIPARLGDVRLRRSYHGVDLAVQIDQQVLASVSALDPEPMSNDDVQYTGTLTLAHTPQGLRLVQVEAQHLNSRVERLTARINEFDGAAWGQPLLDPYFVVSASVAVAEVELPAVRFVCDPDKFA